MITEDDILVAADLLEDAGSPVCEFLRTHNTYDEIIALADWLIDECVINGVHGLLGMLQRPDRWQRELAIHKAWNATSDTELERLLVEALHDEDTTAEAVVAEYEDTKQRNERGTF